MELLQQTRAFPSSGSKDCQNQVYLLKSLNRLSSYSSRTCFLFLLAAVSVGTHLPPDNITMPPIIDLKSSDESFIYSTQSYVKHRATVLNIPAACIIFDQPLWWKAVEIVDAKSLGNVSWLGGFCCFFCVLEDCKNMSYLELNYLSTDIKTRIAVVINL